MKRRNFIMSVLGGIPLLSSKASSTQILKKAQSSPSSSARKRVRELGIKIGDKEPGPYNAITDVPGIKVGHTTIIKGKGKGAVRTGVTAILPQEGNIQEENLFASYFNLNGWGEMTGIAPVAHTGRLQSPIFLTGTNNVGIVYDAAVEYLRKSHKEDSGPSLAPVVAECFDYLLSDTQKRLITKEDVFRAINKARSGIVEEGSVGGGTGMVSFDFKGGIGTSSRVVSMKDKKYTIGVLVMTNTSDRSLLRINGFPVGKEIKGYEYKEGNSKSIILVAATDAPLLPFQLKKISKRVALGLAQTGATSNTGSGDIILAFSTGNKIPRHHPGSPRKIQSLNDFWITPLYKATIEATQEAIINALTTASTIVGRDGNTAYGIPLDQVKKIVEKYESLKNKQHD
ncbi:MAG: S58 family peptidase [Candidatus Aminicenantes bacterium]|nr:S58 family peptidase [Candidatus Aminicenantes bacterium]